MTDEAIRLVQELGFPVAVALGCMLMLGWVVKYILKEKIDDTLKNFGNRHDLLLKEIDEIKKEMHLRFDQERDDTEKVKKWCSEIKSDLKVYIDLTMKGK
ncbi:MAG: hypothetical protein Unbinned4234contig1003_14 [Prokaryotic dsDNA virus sp.]|nr:MAG: hypothetical protein Unbinned4234contig1003_14 [Prokaryotic dsDNA virus sp.]|tara:strand:- start:5055 stop:5354 length:300 start_codon:yes stop_codon:yes gene_type:complete